MPGATALRNWLAAGKSNDNERSEQKELARNSVELFKALSIPIVGAQQVIFGTSIQALAPNAHLDNASSAPDDFVDDAKFAQLFRTSNLPTERGRVSSVEGCPEDEDAAQLLLAAGSNPLLYLTHHSLSTYFTADTFSSRLPIRRRRRGLVSSEFASNLAPHRGRVSSGEGCLEDEDETQLLLAAGQQDMLVPKVKYLRTTLHSCLYFCGSIHITGLPTGRSRRQTSSQSCSTSSSKLSVLSPPREDCLNAMEAEADYEVYSLEISCFSTAAFS